MRAQGRGIGGELLRYAEARVRAAGGRLPLIETSSLPKSALASLPSLSVSA